MILGRVWRWSSIPGHPSGGEVCLEISSLPRLDPPRQGGYGMSGRFVQVRNAGAVAEWDPLRSCIVGVPIGEAAPDGEGRFLFDHALGGVRLDRVAAPDAEANDRARQAAWFGEVNSYYHLDRIADYLNGLLIESGGEPLPRITAVVHAHDAVPDADGRRDGVLRKGRWAAFQGGHYRLPNSRGEAKVRGRVVTEWLPTSVDGEIHLGPGRERLCEGALAAAVSAPYRANASHNAGILYHEYAHHLTRHTADFRGNRWRPPEEQDNRKVPLDEGVCDYWSGVMLGSPHIWAWHRRHDEVTVHPRSLTSTATMAEFDETRGADPHCNGTIWAAALWELRAMLLGARPDGGRTTDRLVIEMLLWLGAPTRATEEPIGAADRRARSRFPVALRALLQADERLYDGAHAATIHAVFARRGIVAVDE